MLGSRSTDILWESKRGDKYERCYRDSLDSVTYWGPCERKREIERRGAWKDNGVEF